MTKQAPKSFEHITTMRGVVLRRKWFGPNAFALLVVALFWNGFLVAWYTLAMRSDGPMRIVMLLFPLIHLLIGLLVAYAALAQFINKTDISIEPDRLTVKTYPLPFGKTLRFDPASIQQLYVKEIVRRTKNGYHRRHVVMLQDSTGKERKLVENLNDASEAAYIEQQLESIMGIRNRPVEGEYSSTKTPPSQL